MLVGALFGLPASLSVSHDAATVTIWSSVAALIGGVASLLLESRDRGRSDSAEWKQRIEMSAQEIHKTHAHLPDALVREAATVREQQRFTPIVWVGIAVGILCALCGVLAFVLKIVALFRP
jgi:ABC-type Mn2+/Zn2+ transport system permease subunit